MNSATRTLLALLAGLAVGVAVRAASFDGLTAAAQALTPLGTLWLAGLKMTLVPLIFALVVGGISSLSGGGKLVGRSVVLFGGLLALSATAGAAIITLLLRVWPVAPGAFDGLGAAPAAPPQVPSILDQFMGMIPANPVAAAAEGAMAPLVVFAVLFGLALARVREDRRAALGVALQGVADAMMVLVGWVLKAAPVGVFALALAMALNTGLKAAGALAQGMVLTVVPPLAGIALCYLIARIGGGVGFVRFARAAIGPQAVAAGTTSSMATLPAMIEAAEGKLGLPPALAGAVLPLAVSTFRFGNVIYITAVALFCAHAAGLEPGLAQIAVMGLVVILTNVGVVGLPASAVIYAASAPAFQAIGAPLELLTLFVATAAIPDVFDTVCNVTADLAASTVMQRWTAGEVAVAPPGAVLEG